MLISFFEKAIFWYKGNVFKKKEEESEEELEERVKKFIKYIENESKSINYDLFKKHFNFIVPSGLIRQLYEIKKRKENKQFVNAIRSGLSDLKDKS